MCACVQKLMRCVGLQLTVFSLSRFERQKVSSCPSQSQHSGRQCFRRVNDPRRAKVNSRPVIPHFPDTQRDGEELRIHRERRLFGEQRYACSDAVRCSARFAEVGSVATAPCARPSVGFSAKFREVSDLAISSDFTRGLGRTQPCKEQKVEQRYRCQHPAYVIPTWSFTL